MTSTDQRTVAPASRGGRSSPLPQAFTREPGSSNRGFASTDPERQRDAGRQTSRMPHTGGTGVNSGTASTSGGASGKGSAGR